MTAAIAAATAVIGQMAALSAAPKAVVATVAAAVAAETPARPIAAAPSPTPTAEIALVTAGCSFRKSPTEFAMSASPLEALSSVGCNVVVNAVLMLRFAWLPFLVEGLRCLCRAAQGSLCNIERTC